MAKTCDECTYWDDYLNPKWCYADQEHHDGDDTCPFWVGKNQRVDAGTGKPYDDPVDQAPLVTRFPVGDEG